MAPDAIAAHALILADFVEAQAGLVANLLALVGQQIEHIALTEAYGITIMIGVRRVQSLATRGQKTAALKLVAEIASNSPPDRTGPVLDVVRVANATALPASLFDPTLDVCEA